MMGRQEVGQVPLFYAFNLEDHVPANHLLRRIDQFLELGGLVERAIDKTKRRRLRHPESRYVPLIRMRPATSP